jgi:hypothetical protein
MWIVPTPRHDAGSGGLTAFGGADWLDGGYVFDRWNVCNIHPLRLA